MLSTSDLSKIVNKLTVISSSDIFSVKPINAVSIKVMTLAPPLFPFPLLETLSLILYASLPKGVPNLGVTKSLFSRVSKSLDNDGNFLRSGFTAILNDCVILTVTFTQKIF